MPDPASAGRVSQGRTESGTAASEAAPQRVRNQPTPPAGKLQLFNRLVPLLKRLERAVPAPFGVSLLAVATVDR